MTGSSRLAVINAQREWALAAGYLPDEQGYLENPEHNLFQPLSAQAQKGLTQGSGSELVDKGDEKAKFKALHSSCALAVNVFDHFMNQDRSSLAKALGLEIAIKSIEFEEKFPTGLRGTPPNLDVVLRLEDGTVIAIESKFTEWMNAVPGKAGFRDSYFPEGKGLWEQKGLLRSQRLAESMHAGEESFSHLNIAQLLKHALGLSNQLGRAFRLYYLFLDWPGKESRLHWTEINRFASIAGQELGFHAISYQDVFHALSVSGEPDASYLEFLGSRYFPGSTSVNAGAAR